MMHNSGDDDEDEVGGLVSNGSKKSSRFEIESEIQNNGGSNNNQVRWRAVVVLILLGTLGSWYVLNVQSTSSTVNLDYACSTNLRVAENYDKKAFKEAYGKDTAKIKTNLTAFMETFRSEDFDNWGRSYDTVKEGMRNWKEQYYPPNLENGDSIYESACGVGLNLFMTLEILNEVKGLDHLVVYGNEYLAESTEKANVVFDMVPPLKSEKGKICTGDSTHLAFVPSNAFDLVFTGYVSPLSDPLHYRMGSFEKNYDVYKQLCEASDEKSQKLNELAQEKQNDFYGEWVGEMVRIAKPGKAVIVEQVSQPYCEEYDDWGGVNQEWWSRAVRHYGWDIDPKSIEFQKDTIFKNRYHVFMRKNPLRSG